MQPKDEIEKAYEKPDPWGFQTNPADKERKRIILQTLSESMPSYGKFNKALDLGAGEGWITKDLPAHTRHAFEISSNAKARLPEGVTGVENPTGFYDLVIATGVLYGHYDYRTFFERIERHAILTVLTCNIKAWERPEMSDPDWLRKELGLVQLREFEFPYKPWNEELTQKLRVFFRQYRVKE